MSSSGLSKLLGTAICLPPPSLAECASCSSEEEYGSFLARSREDPAGYWAEVARGLTWIEAPDEAWDQRGWFPGGRINASANCLDPSSGNRGEGEPLLAELPSGDGPPVEVTRGELRARVEELASRMEEWGLDPGDRVLVALPAGASMVAAVLAGLRLGLTCVPLDPSFARERAPRRLVAADCRAALVDPETAELLEPRPRHLLFVDEAGSSVGSTAGDPLALESERPAFCLADSAGQLFTLPTAGFLVRACSAYRHLLDGRGGEDRLWLLAPAHHVSSLAAVFGALASGGRVGFLPRDCARSPASFLDALKRSRSRILLTDVKTALEPLRDADEGGERPRGSGPAVFAVEGETLEPSSWSYLENGLFDGGTHVVQLLARPEAGGFVAGPHPAVTPIRRSSVALPAPGVDLLVVDVQGELLEPGHGGLLALAETIPGLAMELATLETPLPLEVKARRDRTGYIFPMGEVKVDRGVREPVSIPELEAVITSTPGVDQVAVIQLGKPGSRTRRAYVKPIGSGAGLVETVREGIAEQWGEGAVPETVQLVEELPRSRTGKLLRSVLRRLARGEPLGLDDLGELADPAVVAKLS